MFIINLTYVKPISKIDKYLQEHRDLLDRKYEEGLLLCSGPKSPRTGGIILAKIESRAAVDQFIVEDPFYREGLAKYEVIEFTLTKMAPGVSGI